MLIEEKDQSNVYVIQPQGRLDASSISEFASQIYRMMPLGAHNVLVDLSKIKFLSSSSLRTLIEVYQNLNQAGGKMVFCAPNEYIQDLFEVVMLDKALPIVQDPDEAYHHFMML